MRGATRTGRAFAPGHVTGYFAPAIEARDPRARGSIGAGLVLSLGATADAAWTPGGPSRVSVVGGSSGPLPISEEVARRLAGPLGGRLQVRIVHQLPIGQGFGASASGALATALAVARATGASRAAAIPVAHLADLFGGGGLGGVAAILGGGLEYRIRPGVPPYGRVLHRPVRASVFVGLQGRPIASPKLLNDPAVLDRIRTAAAGLGSPSRAPTLGQFLGASEQFTDTLNLGGRSLHQTIEALRGSGARVAQAMFGRSFFAVAASLKVRRTLLRELERRGLRAVEIRVAHRGAFEEQSLLSRGRVSANP